MSSDSQLDAIGRAAKEWTPRIERTIADLISRGILIPRDEALAAQAALIEQAAQGVHLYLHSVDDASDGRYMAGWESAIHHAEAKVRSLATAPMQAALERHRFAPECCVAAFKEQVHALLQGQIDSLKAAIDRPKPEDYTQEQWAKSGAILKERYAEAIGCQWAIDKLPVNEAALEKVKASVLDGIIHRLEQHRDVMHGATDHGKGWRQACMEFLNELQTLRRAAGKQTPAAPGQDTKE